MSSRSRSTATPAASTLARYTAVDDYGVLVNPMIAAGQAHGAMAQGVGQALLEHATYDPQSGPDGGRLVHGLRPAARRRPAVVRPRLQRHALHDQSAGREGLRRGGRDRGLSRHRQRHPRRAGAARRHRLRRTGDARRTSGRRCRRHDEAPRARRRPQPPAHPRRAAAAPAGARSRARSGERLGRAHRAFRRGPARPHLPAERSRRCGPRQHRRLGARRAASPMSGPPWRSMRSRRRGRSSGPTRCSAAT